MTPDLEKAFARLKVKFIESAHDRLEKVDQAIDQIYNEKGERGDLFFDLQRHIHTIKGSTGSHRLGPVDSYRIQMTALTRKSMAM